MAKEPTQTEKDTAAAKAKQGTSGQIQTGKVGGNKAEGGNTDGGSPSNNKPSSMDSREAAAGLNLAGNDTMSGRGGDTPTMAEREAAAGLNLAGNDTMAGRGDTFYEYDREDPPAPASQEIEIYADDGGGGLPSSDGGGITGIICINGVPFGAVVKGSIGAEIT